MLCPGSFEMGFAQIGVEFAFQGEGINMLSCLYQFNKIWINFICVKENQRFLCDGVYMCVLKWW